MRARFHNKSIIYPVLDGLTAYVEKNGVLPKNLDEIDDENIRLPENYEYQDVLWISLWPYEIWQQYIKGKPRRTGRVTFHIVADASGVPKKMVLLTPFSNDEFCWPVYVIPLPPPPYKGKVVHWDVEKVSFKDFPAKYGHLLKEKP